MKALPIFLLAMFPLSAVCLFADQDHKSGQGAAVVPAVLSPPDKDLTGDEKLLALRASGGNPGPRVVRRRSEGYGLLELSQFVGDGGTSVILPKGSVLFCPEAMAGRLIKRPEGKLVPFGEFLVAHRAWFTTFEVSPAQVRGEAPLPESRLKSFASGGKLVVATMRGFPVTVITPTPFPQP